MKEVVFVFIWNRFLWLSLYFQINIAPQQLEILFCFLSLSFAVHMGSMIRQTHSFLVWCGLVCIFLLSLSKCMDSCYILFQREIRPMVKTKEECMNGPSNLEYVVKCTVSGQMKFIGLFKCKKYIVTL